MALSDERPTCCVGTNSNTLSPRAIVLSRLPHVIGSAFPREVRCLQTETLVSDVPFTPCVVTRVFIYDFSCFLFVCLSSWPFCPFFLWILKDFFWYLFPFSSLAVKEITKVSLGSRLQGISCSEPTSGVRRTLQYRRILRVNREMVLACTYHTHAPYSFLFYVFHLFFFHFLFFVVVISGLSYLTSQMLGNTFLHQESL